MIEISYLKNTWSSDPSHMAPTFNITFEYFHGIGDYFVLTAMGEIGNTYLNLLSQRSLVGYVYIWKVFLCAPPFSL